MKIAHQISLVVITCLVALGVSNRAKGASYADQVAAKPVFMSPLESCGAQPPGESESEALLQSIGVFESGDVKAGMAALENFIAAHPDSSWNPSLRVNMAEYYRSKGRYTLALAHWEKAWEATKSQPQPCAQNLAVRALAGWTRLLASIGQKEKITALFLEMDQLHLPSGPFSPMIGGTREGLASMKSSPGVSYRCGSLAVANMAKALNLGTNITSVLFQTKSPDGGFKLSELIDLAGANGVGVAPVRRPFGGEIVVPSVIHWKLNHYAAIVEKKGDYYKVIDPTFEGHVWMDAQTIDEEGSGAFVVLNEQIPAGWEKLSATESASIYGKGAPNNQHDGDDGGPNSCDPPEDDDSTCDPPAANDGPSGGGGPPDPPCGCGMPVWKVSEPYITLWLVDVPLFYKQSNDKWMKLQLRYKHRGESRGSNLPGFGDKWECNWLGMLTKDSGVSDVYSNHMAGGGVIAFNTNGTPDYQTARKLVVNAGGPPGLAAASGSSISYGSSRTLLSGMTFYTMTRQADRYGRAIVYNYATNGNALVLTNVYDVDGRTNSITYVTVGNYSNLISAVTDPYGRTAHFYYNTNGLLTNITDVMNMPTTFEYDTSDRITNMTTLYGPTVFQYFDGVATNTGYINPNTMRRSLLITEPSGDHQLYAYCDEGPVGVGNDTLFLVFRNSFHWDRKQFAAIPPVDLANPLEMPNTDYLMASTTHWNHGPMEVGSSTVSGTPDATAGPQDISGYRPNPIVFTYPGGGMGTLKRFETYTTPFSPSPALHVLRNEWGRPTNITYVSFELGGSFYAGYTNVYDSSGSRLLTQRGPHGEWVRRYGYDPIVTNLLVAVTNAVDEVLRYAHDTNGMKVISISFPSGLMRSNYYYSSGPGKGFLRTQVDVGFRTNSFGYTAGNMTTQTNELGLVTTYIYDNLNRLVSTAFPDGTTISNVYDKLDLVAVKDRLNQWTRYGYNLVRQLTSETNVNGQITELTYCGCGSPSQVTRWNNGVPQTTLYEYDLGGRLTNTIYADGYRVSRSYDSAEMQTLVQDSGGRRLILTYGQMGLQTYLTHVKSAGSPDLVLFYNQHDEYGRITNSYDRNAVQTGVVYDDLGRVTNRLVTGTAPELFVYNARGLTNYFDPLGRLTIFVRDALSRELFETNANNEALRFTYNPSDELLTLTDDKLQTTSWQYDTFGRVTNKIDALGTNAFRYAYDANDRLTNRISAAKGTTLFHYDALGNLINVVYPVSSNIVYQYDELNRLTNMVDGNGSTAFTWTLGDQLTSEDGPWASDTVSYDYTDRLRTSMKIKQPSASQWSQSYTYNEYGHLAELTSPAGTFGYVYATPYAGSSVSSTPFDSLLVATINYPYGGSSSRAFDAVGRIKTIDADSYDYDVASQRTQHVFAAHNYVNYSYDQIGHLQSAKGHEPDNTPRIHEKFGYGYDKAWNLNFRTNNALVETFTANAANELTTVNRSGTMTVAGSLGNAYPTTSVTVSGPGISGTATVYGDATWAKAGATPIDGTSAYSASATDGYGRSSSDSVTVTLSNAVTFVYDGNGNLLNDGRRYFEYDDENQLTAVTVSNSWRSEFSYDGMLRRRKRLEYSWTGGIWVKTNEVRYVYDGNLVVQEREANNLPQVTYTKGADLSGNFQDAGGIGGLLSRTDNGTYFSGSSFAHSYYLFDGNGNVSSLVNSNGALVAQYFYDPYGNLLSKNGALANVNLYRFSSKEVDINSGLYYYGFRFYDPNLQRWLNSDPVTELGSLVTRVNLILSNVDSSEGIEENSQGLFDVWTAANANRFAGLGNDPINGLDPDGLVWTIVGQFFVGAAVDLGLQLLLNGGRWDCVSWASVFISGTSTAAGYGLIATMGKLNKLAPAYRALAKANSKRVALTNYWKAKVAAANAAKNAAAKGVAVAGGVQAAKSLAKHAEKEAINNQRANNPSNPNQKPPCP